MAGTIPLSMTQQFDIYGKPLSGGQLYIIVAGTVSTPQDAFQDTGLTIKQPYPMTLDAAGRIPQFFLADGSVKIRLQDKSGVVQLAADSVLVIGPSAGGGGGSPVDPTQLIQTGNLILRYGVGVLSGYVRVNGLTVGSATSGATERANADCQALFQYLWGADPNLAVSGGRGASAAADWTANKQLSLPDYRGYALGALEGMGNANSGKLTVGFFGSDPTVLGAIGGGESTTLTLAQTPAGITSNGSVAVTGNSTGSGLGPQIPQSSIVDSSISAASGTAFLFWRIINQTLVAIGFAGSGTANVTSNNTGGQAHRTIGPRKLCTVYVKL